MVQLTEGQKEMGKSVTLFDTGRKYYLTKSYVEETSAR